MWSGRARAPASQRPAQNGALPASLCSCLAVSRRQCTSRALHSSRLAAYQALPAENNASCSACALEGRPAAFPVAKHADHCARIPSSAHRSFLCRRSEKPGVTGRPQALGAACRAPAPSWVSGGSGSHRRVGTGAVLASGGARGCCGRRPGPCCAAGPAGWGMQAI